jgi:hypothetical protein
MTAGGSYKIIPFIDHQPGTKMPPGYYENEQKSTIFHERYYKNTIHTMRKGDTHAQDNHE